MISHDYQRQMKAKKHEETTPEKNNCKAFYYVRFMSITLVRERKKGKFNRVMNGEAISTKSFV